MALPPVYFLKRAIFLPVAASHKRERLGRWAGRDLVIVAEYELCAPSAQFLPQFPVDWARTIGDSRAVHGMVIG
jgi:hypothetical protein